jgi:anti-sigma regulatory factor (Ser/Thr protein kinase)
LQFALCAERFVIDIVDEGEPFDYESYSPPTFPEHWMKGNTRGVGIYLIRQCMDEVSYESIPDRRNRLHLVKHLS